MAQIVDSQGNVGNTYKSSSWEHAVSPSVAAQVTASEQYGIDTVNGVSALVWNAFGS